MSTTAHRRELARFLRSRRARISPADLGLPAGRRRTPGLRREEVASAAGVSLTWYTWLEQGRDIHPSVIVLENIANALRLTAEERRYLFTLVTSDDFQTELAPVSDFTVTPTLRAILDHQGIYPAYLLGPYWHILAWNQATTVLLRDFSAVPVQDRHLLRYMFRDPGARERIPDWSQRARRLIAEFRADASARLTDPPLVELVAGLESESAEFAAAWNAADVIPRTGGTRRFDHPELGALVLEQTTFRLSAAPEVKLIVHVPDPATDTAAKLDKALNAAQ